MTNEEIKAAVISAIQDDQAGNFITESVKRAVEGTLLNGSISGVVAASVEGTLKGKNRANEDPYRTTIFFLAGLITFSLTMIVGIFNAFPDAPIDTGNLTYRMLGGVLAWISITALAATVCSLLAQLGKYAYRQKHLPSPQGWKLAILMGIPIVPGTFAVVYCVRAGSAILSNDTELIGIVDAIGKLCPF